MLDRASRVSDWVSHIAGHHLRNPRLGLNCLSVGQMPKRKLPKERKHMQSSTLQVQDPARACAYFENKLAFTTGPVELERMIKSGDNHFTVVDVRAAEDYAKGHIPGAINLPEGSWERPNGLSKDKTNFVYCYTIVCHLA